MNKKRKQRYIDPKIVAVTGGIGSGQTTVCSFFKQMGCKVINVDEKARQAISRDSSLRNEIRQTFGNDVFYRDGRLNRKKLAAIVFNNETKVQQLNKIVHPRMVATLVEEMETARFSGKYPLVIVDAALIYEINIEQMFDYIIVINAPMHMRFKRLKERDGMGKPEAMARMRMQIPLKEKKAWADFVLENDGSLEDLQRRTKQLFDVLVEEPKEKTAEILKK